MKLKYNLQAIRFLTHDNVIMWHFDKLSNNPLNPVSFMIEEDYITYTIDYAYKRDNVPLPSLCQTFIQSLESRNIKTMCCL